MLRLVRQGGDGPVVSADPMRWSSWRANTISARREFKVELAAAKSQHFGATADQHVAHAVKRLYFRREGHRPGLYSEGRRRSNRAADEVRARHRCRPAWRSQSTSGSKPVLGASHNCRGRWAPRSAALPTPGTWSSIAACPSPRCCSPCGADSRATQTMDAMLTEYMAILSAPPHDESPDLMVDMISRLIDS
jgi:hypothetical protein